MKRSAILRRAGAGFSLVELAVVTLIIGIFLTLGLSAMNAARENVALSSTNAKQAAIKEALIGYLRRNSRLPCPDTDTTVPDGTENRTTPGNPATACWGTIGNAFGILPYVTLGLARDAAQDGWGNFFSYHVSNTVTSTDWTLTANFRTGNSGNLNVKTRTAGVSSDLSTTIVAVVISHGPNGLGGYSIGGTRNAMPTGADELENTNGTADRIFYYRDATTDDAATGGPFDDIVIYLTADDLLNPLYKDGSFKPPATVINEAFTKIKLQIAGYAMSTSSSNGTGTCNAVASPRCRLIPWADSNNNGTANAGTNTGNVPWTPLGLTQADVTDPYGTLYTYTVNTTVATTTTGFSSTGPAAITAATAALVLTASNGTTTTITVGELRGYFLAGTTIP